MLVHARDQAPRVIARTVAGAALGPRARGAEPVAEDAFLDRLRAGQEESEPAHHAERDPRGGKRSLTLFKTIKGLQLPGGS